MDALGRWGVRWIPELGDEDLDPHLLLWDMHRNVDLCDFDPGHEVAITVEADLRVFTLMWRGDLRFDEALRSGGIVLHGPAAVRRAFPGWLEVPWLAVPRPA